MKKLLFLLFAIMQLGSLIAQEKDSVVTLPEVIVTSPVDIGTQVDKSFAAQFPDATDVVWRRLNKDYLTKFMQADVKHQALFKKNGVMKYDIVYMGESHIPKQIADKVKNAYGAYSITNVARIDRARQAFWIINLEGIKNYKVIRMDEGGDMEEVKHYEKAPE